jgi:subtilisin family serine protease
MIIQSESMTRMHFVLILFFIFIVLFILPFHPTSAAKRDRYYVYTDSKLIRDQVGVIHEFGHVFSANLSSDQIRNLNREGIEVELVSNFNLEYSNIYEGEKLSNNQKVILSVPLDQTPWGIERIYNDSAITNTSGGEGIGVAILDTGVSRNHPDLKHRLNDCKDFTSVGTRSTCFDGNGHGTHVSGTVLADAGRDKNGIYGVAPQALLYAYKVCNDDGLCFGDSVAKAIITATDSGVKIISMSFGGSSLAQVEKEALDYADSKAVLLVAAAGNSGPNLNTIKYPAAYSKVIAVAATDNRDAVTDFSSRGINDGDFLIEELEVELAAPGEAIESTWNNGGYRTLSGTSMAVPHTSGLAAKLWASKSSDLNLDGLITSQEIRAIIYKKAMSNDIVLGIHSGIGDDPSSGAGLPTLTLQQS